MKGACVILIVSTLLTAACQDPSEKPVRQSPFSHTTAQQGAAKSVSAATPVRLPQDHASHPEFRLEWWYFTASVESGDGTPFGLQFTLFRLRQPQSPPSHWSDGQRWLAHASVHSPDTHYFEEKVARGGVGNAGVTAVPFVAYIDDWQWQASRSALPGELLPADLTFSVSDEARVTLALTANGPAVLHGDNGFSVKSADGVFRSYYYSLPFIGVRGILTLAGEEITLQGEGWFDHEWTSQLARDDALGWDWLSLSLDDGRKLMAFTMYTGDQAAYTTGTLISSAGKARTLTAADISLIPVGYEQLNAMRLPVEWQVTVPSAGLKLKIAPFKPGQWNPGLVPYYEGRVEVSGSHSGKGFLELTGYQN